MEEAKKALKKMESDCYGGVLIVDICNNTLEIEGHPKLKQILFELSPQIIKRWMESSTSPNQTEKVPEGAKYFLPYLPLGGINSMSITIIELFWSKVMQIVVGHRALGYESLR